MSGAAYRVHVPRHVWAVIKRGFVGLGCRQQYDVIVSVGGKPAVFRLKREAEAFKKNASLNGLRGGIYVLKVPTEVRV